MAAYRPNYTSGSADIMGKGAAGATGNGSLSSWCAGCHTQYNINGSSYDYGLNEGTGLVGARQRHRHPVDMTVAAGDHNLQIFALDDGTGGPDTPGGPKLDNRIPLEVDPNNATQRNGLYVGCLTCHFAHGGTALMSGWSNAHLVQNTNGTWVPQRDGSMGVDPDKVTDPMVTLNGPFVDQFTGGAVAGGTSALLRADNRGVCERCHNK
jgi:hypothetical protein